MSTTTPCAGTAEDPRNSHERQLDHLFAGHQLRVVRTFDLPKGSTMRTAFGLPVRRGCIIRDMQAEMLYAVGYQAAAKIAARFPDSGLVLPSRSG